MTNHAKIHTLPDGTLCVFVPTQDGEDKVLLKDITFLEGASNQTHFHLSDKSKKTVDGSLMYWSEPMLKYGFVRTHYSYVINLLYYIHYRKGRGGYVVMKPTDDIIRVSETYKESFLRTLNDETYNEEGHKRPPDDDWYLLSYIETPG